MHSMVMDQIDPDYIYYVDRRYNENRKWRGNSQNPHNGKSFARGGQGRINPKGSDLRGQGLYKNQGQRYDNGRNFVKRCFVCNKEGCWSSNHSIEERKYAKQQYIVDSEIKDDTNFAQYLADFEGN